MRAACFGVMCPLEVNMSTYPQRVADNILPLSLAGTLPEAFKEWYFIENIEGHEIAEEDCKLCDQEQLSLGTTSR